MVDAIGEVGLSPRSGIRLCTGRPHHARIPVVHDNLADVPDDGIADDRPERTLITEVRDLVDRTMRRCVPVAIDLIDQWLHVYESDRPNRAGRDCVAILV